MVHGIVAKDGLLVLVAGTPTVTVDEKDVQVLLLMSSITPLMTIIAFFSERGADPYQVIEIVSSLRSISYSSYNGPTPQISG
jgi:hypothetical protein